MNLKLARNAFFFAQAALLIVLLFSLEVLYLPGPVQLLLALAFGVSGLVVLVLTARLDETGVRKFFFFLTGASAAAIPVFAILHNFMFEHFFFVLALFVCPALFVVGWLGSVVLMGPIKTPISQRGKLAVGLVISVFVAGAIATVMTWGGGEGYSVTSELVKAPGEEIERVFVAPEVDEALGDVVYHSFEHSLISALESNGIAATVDLLPDAPERTPELQEAIDSFSPDATMHIRIEPLYRTHRKGFEAIVGTVFQASLKDGDSGQELWQVSGKVDYVVDRAFANPNYTVSHGMKKEFAFMTTAAIVRTFMDDVVGRESAPIYTDIGNRERHGQRSD